MYQFKITAMPGKIFKNIVFFTLLMATVTSCSKWMELQPPDGITRQEYWKTKEQIQSALTGCYASLLGDATGGKSLSEYLFLWGELRGDMIVPAIGATNDELDVTNVNTLPTNSISNWATIYKVINYCNTVVDFAPGVLANDNTLTQTQLNAYLGEARALRALMYFYLVRTFRDVPLKLKSTSTDNDIEQIPKTSQDTILRQVVADLAFADSNVVIAHTNPVFDKGQINKYTVKAIQADVFLWMDKYQECVAACDYIINSNQFGLVAGDDGWFNNLYFKGNSSETIFEFQFDAQKLNTFYPMFATTKSRFLASSIVMDEVYTIDFINAARKDIRGEGASVRTSDNAIWKYIGITFNSSRSIDASYAHWFVYRFADILLMKAEALNQIGGRGAEALDLVNKVRTRAKALAATNTNPDPADKNALGDYILAERQREFSFEGKRWYDVLRNAKRNSYARLDLIMNMVVKSVQGSRQQSALGKYRDYNSHYFPIYQNEILINPKLVQNPFYK